MGPGALKGSRFMLILGTLLLVGLFTTFYFSQSSKEYMNFSTDLRTSFLELRSTLGTTKTIKDVVSNKDGTFTQMKDNKLFGLSFSGTTSDIRVLDSFTGALNSVDSGSVAPANKVGVIFLLSDDSTQIPNAIVGGAGLITTLGTMNTQNKAGNINDSITRGWNLDQGGYIGYVFPSTVIAQEMLGKYLNSGKLVGKATVAVPFGMDLVRYLPVPWSNVQDNLSLPSPAGGSVNFGFGVKFTSLYNQQLLKVTKISSVTATTVQLYSGNRGTLLATSTFSGNIAIFNYTLLPGTNYIISVHSGAVAYTPAYQGLGATYLQSGTNVNFIGCDQQSGFWSTYAGNVASIETKRN